MPRVSNLAWIGLFGAALLLAGSPHASENPIAFATRGGDAWSFDKAIDIVVSGPRCDHVAISSPLTSVVMPPVQGHVQAHLMLGPGDNRVEAECRDQGVVAGTVEENWRVRLRDAPKASIRVSANKAGVVLDALSSTPAPVRAAAITRYEWQTENVHLASLAGLPTSGPHLDLPASIPDGEYSVSLKVVDEAGRADTSAVLLRAKNGVLREVDPEHDHAAWIDRAVFYGVVPGLFGARGLPDVTAHLDELSELGVTALWLSPLMDSPPGDFGYAVTNYFHLRANLGSEEDLHALIRAAHARGIRVILDFVPNHLSNQSAYFADASAYLHASPYFDFFARDGDGRAQHYFDWVNLENLNYANPEVDRFVIEAFAYWVREFDVDGFRVDAAWGPRRRAPDFWPRWRTELKRIKPDLMLLAEASARDAYYGQNGFDAAYDWTDKLGEWAWSKAFDDETNTAQRLHSAIEASLSEALTFRFLDNNDTGPRFRSRYGIDRTRIAAAMLLTLPGIPCLYTGDEVGATYEPYKDATPLTWGDPYGLRKWYQRLIAMRRKYPVLRSHDLHLLDVTPDKSVLVYVRPDKEISSGILVILNYGQQATRVTLDDAALDLAKRGKFVDLLSGDEVAVEHSSIAIGAQSVRILKPR